MNKKLAKAAIFSFLVVSNVLETILTVLAFAITASLTSIAVAMCIIWFIIHLVIKIVKNGISACEDIHEGRKNGKY